MFGGKTNERLERLEANIDRAMLNLERIKAVLGYVVFPAPKAGLFGPKTVSLVSLDELSDLRKEVRALAAAIGYEWVPEGKTKAEWRKAPSDESDFVLHCRRQTDHHEKDTPKREKGGRRG